MLGVVAGVLGYLLWRYLVPDLPGRLFPLLPDNHALYVYADIEAMREGALFSDAASAPGWELIDRHGYFAEDRVFLSKAEVKGAVLSVGEHELRAVLSGRFTAQTLMAHVERQGGHCEDRPVGFTCSVDSPEADIRLRLPSENLLEIVDRPPQTVEPADPGNAAFLAAPARQSIREGAVLWMALQPSLLEAVMRDPPRDMVNLALFARALRQATWAYLTLGYSRTASTLQLHLQAFTETPEDAKEMHGVLSGLNEFVAATVDKRSSNAGAGLGAKPSAPPTSPDKAQPSEPCGRSTLHFCEVIRSVRPLTHSTEMRLSTRCHASARPAFRSQNFKRLPRDFYHHHGLLSMGSHNSPWQISALRAVSPYSQSDAGVNC